MLVNLNCSCQMSRANQSRNVNTHKPNVIARLLLAPATRYAAVLVATWMIYHYHKQQPTLFFWSTLFFLLMSFFSLIGFEVAREVREDVSGPNWHRLHVYLPVFVLWAVAIYFRPASQVTTTAAGAFTSCQLHPSVVNRDRSVVHTDKTVFIVYGAFSAFKGQQLEVRIIDNIGHREKLLCIAEISQCYPIVSD